MKKLSILALAGSLLLLAACKANVTTDVDTVMESSSSAAMEETAPDTVMDASSSDEATMDSSSSAEAADDSKIEGDVDAGASASVGVGQ